LTDILVGSQSSALGNSHELITGGFELLNGVREYLVSVDRDDYVNMPILIDRRTFDTYAVVSKKRLLKLMYRDRSWRV
jgi:hypothetical protein